MLRSPRLSWMPFSLALAVLSAADAFAAPLSSPVASAPCSTSTKTAAAHPGEQACKDFLSSGPVAAGKPTTFLSAMDQLLRGYAESFYNGCETFDEKTAASSEASRRCRRTVAKETCNTLSNQVTPSFNGAQEKESNHQGKSCGDWPRFTTRVGGDACSSPGDQALIRTLLEGINRSCTPAERAQAERDLLTAVDVLSDSCKNAYFDFYTQTENACIQSLVDDPQTTCRITPDYSGSLAFIEDSYIRGAWIQALNCHSSQVRNEIRNGGKISLTHLRGTDAQGKPTYSGPCLQIAENMETLRSRIDAQANIKDIENCTENEVGSSTDPGRMRQSACHLYSARRTVEALFTSLAACEIFQRALDSYTQFLSLDLSARARAELDRTLSSSFTQCTPENALDQYKRAYANELTTWGNIFWNADSCK